MKKTYKYPALRVIDLTTEGMIAESFNTSDEEIVSDDMMSNKQNMWDRESIWK